MATAPRDAVIRHLRRAVSRQAGAAWTDSQLLASFLDRQDEAAFEALVRRHGPMVLGVCRRVVRNHHDAEDAFQATFLVLARRASSVRPRERLANWLHGVALRTALKAKALTARRRAREKQVSPMPEPEAAPQDPWRDLQPLLDQELNGLPENYRLPILLCDLEGKTIQEATRQLGWPQGTLAGRLARGRKLLAKRLANRGVALSAGTLAAVVSPKAASSAAVPTLLLSATVKAAVRIAAGQAAVAGVVPVRVALLTEGVLKAMLLSKLKTVTGGLLLVALLLGAAGAIYKTPAAEQPKDEPRNKKAVSAPGEIRPPQVAEEREYVITSKLMEAGADGPRELLGLPRVTVEDGQQVPLHIPDVPRNLLEHAVREEKIQIGTFLDVRVRRLEGNKVRLVLTFQENDVEKSSVSGIEVLGHSLQVIRDIEFRKPVKLVYQKDVKGSARRWVEITVEEQVVPALADSGPLKKAGKKSPE